MKWERIDAFDINFVDSAARSEFKSPETTGTGESRIYVGSNEKELDEFFEFENIEYFITEKTDLLKYLDDAYNEYMFPTQDYKANISDMYTTLKNETENITQEKIKYTFRKTFDNQRRYFLVLTDTNSRKNYNYIKNIALPCVTKFCFIKFIDKDTNKKIIYMRPILFNDNNYIKNEIDDSVNTKIEIKDNSEEHKRKTRKRQNEYRKQLLQEMPFCPFIKVADDRILVACHIKPFSKCDTEDEQYDCKNGITMTPTYHCLFDLGFISFNDDGTLLVSPFLSNITKERLYLKDGDRKRLQQGSDRYLAYHREFIYCKMPDSILEEEDIE